MTSKTSSNKPALYTFLSAFGSMLATLDCAVIGMLIIALAPPMSLDNLKLMFPDMTYLIINHDRMPIILFLIIFHAIAGAVVNFGFIHNKRTSTAYLSLPIRRGSMFIAKYSAGLIIILIPYIVYITWLFLLNIRVFGYSAHLMQGYLILMSAIFTGLFSVYSITSAVCFFVGTKLESVIFSLVIMYGATILAHSLTFFFRSFLPGNAFGENTGSYMMYTISLSNRVAAYLPATRAAYFIGEYGSLYDQADRFDMSVYLSGIVVLVIWVLLSIVVSYIAYKAFKRYKAENSGVPGINEGLNFIGTFTAVFFAFSMPLSPNYSNIVKILLASVFSFIAFVICRSFVTLNIKKAFSNVHQYFVMAAAIFALFILCSTGMYGYSSYQPDLNDIESAAVTYTGASDYILDNGYEVGSADRYVRIDDNMIFISEKDIQSIYQLHKDLINAGVNFLENRKHTIDDIEKDRIKNTVYFQYNLKNGKTVNRVYKSIPAQILIDMLKLDDTDLIGQYTDRSFELLESLEDFNFVSVTDSLFTVDYTLDSDVSKKLFNVLKEDINNLQLEEKYFPEHRAGLAVVFPRIRLDHRLSIYENYLNNKISNELGNGIIREITGDLTYPMYNLSTYSIRIFITDSFVNTIEFLKEEGIYETVAASSSDVSKISEMYIERYQINDSYDIKPLYFRAYASNTFNKPANSITIAIEHDEYNNILDRSRNNYYVAGGGYLVRVLTKTEEGNDKWTTLFLPESNAPDYIKSKLSDV